MPDSAPPDAWVARLTSGDHDAAWDLFVKQYQRLLFATIRHYATDYDDMMDIFAWVCEALRANDLARLRGYLAESGHRARLSTWLVVVVRHLIVDWFRKRDGRPRLSAAAAALPALQRLIFQYVFLDGRSHVEAYELITTRDGHDLAYAAYTRELAGTYRAMTAGRKGRLPRELAGPWLPEPEPEHDDPAQIADARERTLEALATLPADLQLAVRLFVIDDVPAEDVARIVGWANAKAVYNRVHRALAALRSQLERLDIGPGDA